MANTLNKVLLLGNLVFDPEMRKTQADVSVCDARLAVRRKYGKPGSQEVDFINFTAMRHHADYLCRYFKKGDRIIISGELHVEDYRDADGNKKSTTKILVEEIIPFKDPGRRNAEEEGTYDAPAYAKNNAVQFTHMGNDDLPF